MRRSALLVFCFCLILPLGSQVVAQHSVSVRGNVGATFFQSPEGMNSVLNSGIDLGLGTSIQLYKGLELTLQGAYDQFTLNGDNLALLDQDLQVGAGNRIEGGTYEHLSASVGFRYVFQNQSAAHPYMSGGVGIYRSSIAGTRVFQGGQLVQRSYGRSTTTHGYHFGVGADFQIDDTFTFFFEPRLVIVATDSQEFGLGSSTRYIPVRLGVDVEL